MTISYETVRNLEEAGMPTEQAAAVAGGISAQAVERSELELTETRLEASIERLGSRIEASVAVQNAAITALDSKIDARIEGLDSKIEGLDSKIDASVAVQNAAIAGLDSRIEGLGFNFKILIAAISLAATLAGLAFAAAALG